MYLKQADVFWGTSRDFNKDIVKITTRMTCSSGDALFREGDVADTFYVLRKGRVKLTIGSAGNVVYIINHAGEAFG